MARGTSLSTLLTMLKAEVGDSSNTNTAMDATYIQLLSNKQQWLATEYAWPFMEQRWNVSASSGIQFLALPTTTAGQPVIETVAINLDHKPLVECYFNTVWSDVDYGIGKDEYNTLDFSLGQQSDPIQRWRMASNSDESNKPNYFEVWPVPVTNQVIRFTGQRMPNVLATPASDKADLDDLLLVYFVAAERLQRTKQGDAQLKLQLGQRRLQMLRQNYPVRSVSRTMDGQGDSEWKKSRRITGMTIITR